MNPEKEAAYILGGEVAILAGPELVRDATEDFGVGYEEVANTEIGGALEGVEAFAQGVAPALGVAALAWLGLKTVVKGLESNNKSGFAS